MNPKRFDGLAGPSAGTRASRPLSVQPPRLAGLADGNGGHDLVQDDAELECRRLRYEALWAAAHSNHPRLLEYLRHRGLTEAPPALRRIEKFGTNQGPAMVARVVGPDGELRGLHITHLAPDGPGKAMSEPVRQLLPKCHSAGYAGAAIRLDDGPIEELHVAEGVETALAVLESGFAPVWCVLSTSGLRTFLPSEDTHSLTVWADHDASHAGESAATVAIEAARKLGVIAHAIVPDAVGTDWLDQYVAHGKTALVAARAATIEAALSDLSDVIALPGPRSVEIARAEVDEWPPLTPIDGDVQLPPLAIDRVPEVLRTVSRHLADQTGIPQRFPLLTGAAVASIALTGGHRVGIPGTWISALSIFSIAAAPSGRGKSAAFDPLIEAIIRMENELRPEAKREQVRNLGELDAFRAQKKQFDSVRHRGGTGPSPEERGHLALEIQRLERLVRSEFRIYTQTATPQALEARLAISGGRQLVANDESAGLIELLKTPDGGANLSVLIQGYDGAPVRSDRITRACVDLPRAEIALALGLQPMVLEQLLSIPVVVEQGFIARCLLTEIGDGEIGEPSRKPLTGGAVDKWHAAIAWLFAEFWQQAAPRTLCITERSYGVLLDLRARMATRARIGGDLDECRAWALRAHGNALRLAALFTGLAEARISGTFPHLLPESQIEAAVEFMESLAPHAAWVHRRRAPSNRVKDARRVLAAIERHLASRAAGGMREVSRGEINGHIRNGPLDRDPEALSAALDRLVRWNYLRKLASNSGVGRPTDRYAVHPDFKTETAALVPESPENSVIGPERGVSNDDDHASESLADLLRRRGLKR